MKKIKKVVMKLIQSKTAKNLSVLDRTSVIIPVDTSSSVLLWFVSKWKECENFTLT